MPRDEQAPLTPEQDAAVDRVLELFGNDPHKVCEAMGLTWDENMGWNW